MKKRKIFLILTTLITCMAIWYASKLIWFKPLSIDHFFERAMVKYALKDNQQMSELGLFGSVGRHLYNDKLTNISPESQKSILQLLEQEHKILKSYDRSKLNSSQQTSYDLLDWFLNNQAEGAFFSDYSFKLNSALGLQKKLPEYMVNSHLILDKTDAKHYIKRLEAFDTYFDQLLQNLKVSEEKKIIPPTFLIESALYSMKDFIATPVDNSILLTAFETKLEGLKLSQNELQDLKAEAAKAIKATVYPAYENLISYYTQLLPKSRDYVGIWNVPGGDKYYEYMIRSYTTLDKSSSEVFDIVYEDVKKLNQQIEQLSAADATSTEGSTAPLVTIEDCQQLVDNTTKQLPKLFKLLPKAKVTVQLTPDTGGVQGGIQQYNASDITGTRPATIYITSSLLYGNDYTKQWVLYHEGVPGHHLQLAINNEQKNVPSFRRILGFSAFTEGWATYAQHLPWEFGLEKSNQSIELDMLRTKLEHAGRVLLDIGINAKRWTRQQAIDFAYDNNICSRSAAESYIEFCTTYPGIECSYEIGCLKIMELRERAKAELGKLFDIRDFHTAVLKNGSIPLDMLEKQIDQYIRDTKAIATN